MPSFVRNGIIITILLWILCSLLLFSQDRNGSGKSQTKPLQPKDAIPQKRLRTAEELLKKRKSKSVALSPKSIEVQDSQPKIEIIQDTIEDNTLKSQTNSGRKPRKVQINFAHNCCHKSQSKNCREGIKWGMDECRAHNMTHIDSDFYQKNEKIFSEHRGGGYWLWKPYIILKTLESLEDGDVVVYTDSGSYFVDSVEPLIKVALEEPRGIILFWLCGEHGTSMWTKADAFVLMDCETEACRTGTMMNAAFIVMRKGPDAIDFVKKYLEYAQDDRIITDKPNTQGVPNFPSYRDHRHDQSILSLLAIKEGIKGHRDPTGWGTGCKDGPKYFHGGDYGILIEHSRDKS